MTHSSIQAIAAQEAQSVSPYLLRPSIDRPAYFRGQKVPVPGEFGHRVVIDMKWDGRAWDYQYDTDAAELAEKRMLEMNRARLAA